MDKDNRKYRFCFIDYMWYVAEIWHEREHTNLNGRMLLFFCWLFAILVPLGTPLMFRYFSRIVAFAIVMMLCFLPDLFCQLRYTAGRREALREYYGKMKHPGRKLAKIVLIAIALTVVNVALMFSWIYTLGMINGRRISIGSISGITYISANFHFTAEAETSSSIYACK